MCCEVEQDPVLCCEVEQDPVLRCEVEQEKPHGSQGGDGVEAGLGEVNTKTILRPERDYRYDSRRRTNNKQVYQNKSGQNKSANVRQKRSRNRRSWKSKSGHPWLVKQTTR